MDMVVMVPRLGKRENKCRGVDILIGERERWWSSIICISMENI